jgi:hypothetical protein
MIDTTTIREFYQRLNHQSYGLTEIAIFDTNRLVATGFFDNEQDIISVCQNYNRYNIYAGRNPRPFDISRNSLDSIKKNRAKDKDIKYLTAISLDIDPIREKDSPSTEEQHQQAIDFALELSQKLGGGVDDSGNGSYLWIPFLTPIEITSENFSIVKKQCALWQYRVTQDYMPEKYNLRIDGCYDFSRLKRVIGTYNHKAQRLSKIILEATLEDTVREAILSIEVEDSQITNQKIPVNLSANLPEQFSKLLNRDKDVRELWNQADPGNDTSRHDWLLGLKCIQAGITDPGELAVILMNNPYGKYQRDSRQDYVQITVSKLLGGQNRERY